MPIVIKELVITAVVDGNADQQATSAATSSPEAQQQIIQACVEQVLAILEEKKER
ncbi:DUF5908 family protein [Hymenobacter cavernae]|uniref:Uncharacterized protein n=1 Tax=Hymenobacter cavernae TaxID=2044852 RepID=A0ABQ1USW3_9BACT|nr:DUF5908 family protein [Hymenobacter cavernae]GGF24443.1 hypothetical protein GCM10011383_40100 [Hymenobacter cavernae]